MRFNNSIYLLVLLFISIGFSSCKKGENDPAISFRSRDSRITGEWELVSMESTTKRNGTDCEDPETTKRSFDGTDLTENYSGKDLDWNFQTGETECKDTTRNSIVPYSRTMKIREDGTYEVNISEDGKVDAFEGDWHWLDAKKNKSRIKVSQGWSIDRLTNDELVLLYENYYKYTNDDGSWYDWSVTKELTFEKK